MYAKPPLEQIVSNPNSIMSQSISVSWQEAWRIWNNSHIVQLKLTLQCVSSTHKAPLLPNLTFYGVAYWIPRLISLVHKWNVALSHLYQVHILCAFSLPNKVCSTSVIYTKSMNKDTLHGRKILTVILENKKIILSRDYISRFAHLYNVPRAFRFGGVRLSPTLPLWSKQDIHLLPALFIIMKDKLYHANFTDK